MNDEAIGKMFTDLERAEAKLLRAFNRWVKLKSQVRRFDKRYAKELAASVPTHALPKGGEKPWPVKTHKVTNIPVRQPKKYRGKASR